MNTIKNFKEWRAEEIAKLFLLKSTYPLIIEKFPAPIFDLFITLKKKPKIKFAVEVKEVSKFNKSIAQLLKNVRPYFAENMVNIPVLIFKINEEGETGELDFLITSTHKGEELKVNDNFNFKRLSPDNLDAFIEKIENWWT